MNKIRVWARGSRCNAFKRYKYFIFPAEQIFLCNFGQEHFGKHSCDSIVMLIKGI